MSDSDDSEIRFTTSQRQRAPSPHHLTLWVADDGAALSACVPEHIVLENLKPGTRIYDLGIAWWTVPPGRLLAEVGEVSKMLTDNVPPIIEVPR